MAADYKLDLEGDLDLSTAAYELVEDAQQIRQAVQIGLATDQGEWFENILAGVPWLNTILSQRGTQDFMDAYIIGYLVDTFPEIEEITQYNSEVDATQTARITFNAQLVSGQTIEFTQEI